MVAEHRLIRRSIAHPSRARRKIARADYATLTRDWQGRTVYLLGGGPSLKGFDFRVLEGKGVVVAINDAILHAPAAQVAFTIDVVWHANRADEIRAALARGVEVVSCIPGTFDQDIPGVRYLSRRRGAALSRDMGAVHSGENSGFAALGMALMRGAARIGLLGYDMTKPGHFHEGYDWYCRFGAREYPRWARMFSVLAFGARQAGVQVLNCNDQSGIRCFPFGKPEDIAE